MLGFEQPMAVLAPNYKPWVDGQIRKKPFVLPIPLPKPIHTTKMSQKSVYRWYLIPFINTYNFYFKKKLVIILKNGITTHRR